MNFGGDVKSKILIEKLTGHFRVGFNINRHSESD